ncbi:hypothetical protein STCU_04174 [Strigomonas culicis]|uniref:Uncharacterized protein n=1 Tax=Strigomonas culicis TaxID=28005 RepID=S9UMR2_9TRYP|nr:hypothetical protein STCU_04174 [Strigomonas culicis]|eukprot:EPY30223.1 hypothetical protein STCU_04174 [Strigomonas culicis]
MFGADKHSFLGGVKKHIYRCVARPHKGSASAVNAGSIDAYVEQNKDAASSARCRTALFNNVKVCPTCGKPNGYTMTTCNQCQGSLVAVALSTTPNLFTAFLLSIAEGPKFPLKVSMRTDGPDVMVFDDPLALSPLHFCAIPTEVFIPDWRYLTLNPQRGLQVCQLLVDSCHAAAREQFLSDEVFCSSILREKDFDVATQMIMGFNFPPSQNQIHIQYMLPVLMPHQYMLFLRGVHYTAQRFFPVSYVHACLVQLVKRGTAFSKADLDLDVGAFIARLEEQCGVCYAEVHAQFLIDVDRLHQRYAKWDNSSFTGSYKVMEGTRGKLVFTNAIDGKETIVDEHEAYEGEKSILQNYGKDGQETGSFGFYSFPKPINHIDFSFLD